MTAEILAVVVVVAAVIALWFAADRARTIAVCSIVRGKVRVTRGRLAPRVLAELRDVAERMRIGSATVTIKKEDGAPTLFFRGEVDERAAQQLRNVVGRFKVAELR